MADHFESSQDNPDRKGQMGERKPPAGENKQPARWPGQSSDGRATKKENPRADGKQQEKTNGNRKKKFSGNCFVCGRAGHRVQDCFKKASAIDGKGKANVAEAVPKQEN